MVEVQEFNVRKMLMQEMLSAPISVVDEEKTAELEITDLSLNDGGATLLVGLDDKAKGDDFVLAIMQEKLIMIINKKNEAINTYEYNFIDEKLVKNKQEVFNQPKVTIIRLLREFSERNKSARIFRKRKGIG